MQILSNNFLTIKNTYIIPLIGHNPSGRYDMTYYKVKNIIKNHTKRIQNTGKNHYLIELSKDYFYKALFNEIVQFYLKMTLQYNDLINIEKMVTKSWLLVTDYYKFFYSICCLFRMMHRGYIFIEPSLSKEISHIFTALTGTPIQFNSGTYFFIVTKTVGNDITIDLNVAAGSVHESSWNKFYLELIQMEKQSDSDEKVVLAKIKKVFSTYNSIFPSQLRNDVNYKGEYIYKEIDKDFFYNIANNDIDNIGRIILKSEIIDNLNSKNKFLNLIGMYFYNLTQELFNEIVNRSGKIYYHHKCLKNKMILLSS